MKILIATFFMSAIGCATYDARLINAIRNPRGGIVSVTFNDAGEEKAKKLARYIMRKYCKPSGYEVTAIEMTQETNSRAVMVPNQYLNTTHLISNSRTDFSDQPIVHFKCASENDSEESELDL